LNRLKVNGLLGLARIARDILIRVKSLQTITAREQIVTVLAADSGKTKRRVEIAARQTPGCPALEE